MDLHTPLDPTSFAHLRVSTMMRRAPSPVCCVCHERPIYYGSTAVCKHPGCYITAIRLGWWK